MAHSMAAFAAVAIVLAIAGAGVQLYPGLFTTAPQETVVATLAEPEPAAGPEVGAPFRWERGTSGSEPAPDPAAELTGPSPIAQPGPPEEAAPVIADEPPRQSLAGVWTLETEIESSSLRAFEGLRLGYRLELRQEGDRIEGTGLKVAENGIALSAARRTPITVHGTLGEGRVRLTFGEQGALRRTTGTLDLVLDENGVLRGGFASKAARSAGAVKARRL